MGSLSCSEIRGSKGSAGTLACNNRWLKGLGHLLWSFLSLPQEGSCCPFKVVGGGSLGVLSVAELGALVLQTLRLVRPGPPALLCRCSYRDHSSSSPNPIAHGWEGPLQSGATLGP